MPYPLPKGDSNVKTVRNQTIQQRKEGDLVVGPASPGIVTLVERNTRFALVERLPGVRDSATVIDVIRNQIMCLPEHSWNC